VLDEADCTVDVERRGSVLLETVEFSEFEVLLVTVSAKTDKKTSVRFHMEWELPPSGCLFVVNTQFLTLCSTFALVSVRYRVPRSCDRRFESRPWLLCTKANSASIPPGSVNEY